MRWILNKLFGWQYVYYYCWNTFSSNVCRLREGDGFLYFDSGSVGYIKVGRELVKGVPNHIIYRSSGDIICRGIVTLIT